jgi:hypothetical protein
LNRRESVVKTDDVFIGQHISSISFSLFAGPATGVMQGCFVVEYRTFLFLSVCSDQALPPISAHTTFIFDGLF